MRLSLTFLLLVGVVFVANAANAATTPAHGGGGRGKLPNVASVCSSSVKAWKSQSACSTFEQGICDTVTSGETCSNLCPFLTSQEEGGCSLVNQAELNDYHIPLRLGVRTTLSGDGAECTQTPVMSWPPEYTGPPIVPNCDVITDQGVSVVVASAMCPAGYLIVQAACAMLPQAGVALPVNAPFFVEFNDLALCYFPTTGNEGRYFGLHVVCMRYGGDQMPDRHGGRGEGPTALLRDLVLSGLAGL